MNMLMSDDDECVGWTPELWPVTHLDEFYGN